MVRVYRKGNPSPNCCWFRTSEEALNWDGNSSKTICRLVLLAGEFNAYFEANGVRYKINKDDYNFLEKRIEKYNIDDFTDLCNDPKRGRFM